MDRINPNPADDDDQEQRLSLIDFTPSGAVAAEDGGDDDGDEEEALSLCDLPLIPQTNAADNTKSLTLTLTTDDFDFCPSKESEMCAADELFHQGQILPLLHRSGSSQTHLNRSISRSESMDYHSSSSSSTVFTSRSSSIRSSSSGSSSAANSRKPPRNLFHSHPSPSPKILQQGTATRTTSRTNKKSSSPWNIFRLGLLTSPPKIAFQDLKSRTNSKNAFGSRNSSSSSGGGSDAVKKPIPNLLAGCNCGLDDTVPPKAAFMMKRSMSDGHSELRALQVEEEANLLAAAAAAAKSSKKRASHYRTFEWLKQLSVEASPEEPP